MPGKFVIRTAKNGKTFFSLKATNGQVILSSEMYDTRKAAEKGVASVKKNAASEKRFERKISNKGENYFILKAANGEPIGRSEMYSTKRGMENGLRSVQKNAPDATIANGDNKK